MKQGEPAASASLYYVTAALATGGIVPFTLIIMMPTNKRLEARARRDDDVKAEGSAGMTIIDQERAKRERESRYGGSGAFEEVDEVESREGKVSYAG